MENLFYILFLLALGKAARKLPAYDEKTPYVLNQFVIYLSFPATILLKIKHLELSASLLVLGGIPWVLVMLSTLVVGMISRWMKWDKPMAGAVLLSVALANTSFFGYPAVAAFFGEDNLGYAIIYDQFGSFFALCIFGSLVVSVWGSAKKATFKMIVMKIFGFPPFLALVAGFLLMPVAYPSYLSGLLEGLSATLIPMVIFSVGTQLRFRQSSADLVPIGMVLFLKMVVSPAAAFGMLVLLGIKGDMLKVCVFQSAMPTMVLAGVLAVAGNLRGDIANAAIGYGILFSFITLPLLYFLMAGM